MTDPLRTAPASDGSADADRDALIERLLLAGLDHYFEGRYEQAVNIWTRVAFLERGHGRARAYIERARGALAEQQRETEEFLHRGLEAFRTGDLANARELLTRAVADGGSETALVFLQRLGVAEAGHAAAATLPRGSLDATPSQLLRRHTDRAPRPRATNWTATISVCLVIASAIFLAAQPIASWLGEQPVVAPLASPRASDPVPIVRMSEIRLARAKALYESGKLQEALRALDAIDRGDPLRRDADTLIASIQGALLATVPTSPPAEEAAR
jgi:tetratricopeptide (TPR) repeat protein